MCDRSRTNRVWIASALAAVGVCVVLSPTAGAAAKPAGQIAYLAWAEGGWQVWTMAPDGSSPKQVTHSSGDKTRISWFPDGKQLLVNGVNGVVSVVDVASGKETPVELPVQGAIDAVISPDGQRIAFSLSPAESRDDNEIYLVGVDGKDLRKLTDMEWLQHQPQWSADGEWLYFLSGDGERDHDIWRQRLDGSRREQLTAGAYFHFEVAVAPDGRLAYSNNSTGDYEVYVQVPGEGVRGVGEHVGLDGHPSWSPDGKALIIHSMRSGRMNLWRIDLESGQTTQLSDLDPGARNPVWWHPPEGSR